MRIKKRKYTIGLIGLVIILGFSYFVGTNEVKAEEDKKVIELKKSAESASEIFNKSDGLWYPGRLSYKSLYIKNSSEMISTVTGVEVKEAIKDINGREILNDSLEYKNFNKFMQCRIDYGRKTVYQGSFSKLIEEGIKPDNKLKMDPNSEEKLDITVWMEKDSDNTIQGVEAIIDAVIRCNSEDVKAASSIIPKTGAFLDITMLVAIGLILMILGTMFVLKKSDMKGAKGDKDEEYGKKV